MGSSLPPRPQVPPVPSLQHPSPLSPPYRTLPFSPSPARCNCPPSRRQRCNTRHTEAAGAFRAVLTAPSSQRSTCTAVLNKAALTTPATPFSQRHPCSAVLTEPPLQLETDVKTDSDRFCSRTDFALDKQRCSPPPSHERSVHRSCRLQLSPVHAFHSSTSLSYTGFGNGMRPVLQPVQTQLKSAVGLQPHSNPPLLPARTSLFQQSSNLHPHDSALSPSPSDPTPTRISLPPPDPSIQQK